MQKIANLHGKKYRPVSTFLQNLRNIVKYQDPNISDKKFVCKEVFWWDGFEIMPPRPKLGLLTNFANREEEHQETEESSGECTEEESTTSVSSDTEGSAESNPRPCMKPVKRRNLKRKLESTLWQPNLSARSNQDIQRAYEEKTIKEITEFLNRNVIIDSLTKRGSSKTSTPVGGIWVRLEQEWRENSQKNGRTAVATIQGKNNRFRGK